MKRYYATKHHTRVCQLGALRKKYEMIDNQTFDKAVKKAILEELKLKIQALEYILN